MGWFDGRASRDVRFKTLLAIGVKSGDSLLDLGCGSGQLIRYLNKHKLKIKYTGIDVAEAPIDYAKTRYPQHTFICDEVENLTKKYDWIIISGTFNLEMPKEKMVNILKHINKLAIKGVASNFLHADMQDADPAIYRYYRPKDVIQYVDGKVTTLEHDKCGLVREFVIYWRKRRNQSIS